MIRANVLNRGRCSAAAFSLRQGVAPAVMTVTGRNFSGFNKLYGPYVNGAYEIPGHLKSNTFAVNSPSTSEHLCDVISADKEYVDRAGNNRLFVIL